MLTLGSCVSGFLLLSVFVVLVKEVTLFVVVVFGCCSFVWVVVAVVEGAVDTGGCWDSLLELL